MIIIPDIHGRTFWKDCVKGHENEQKRKQSLEELKESGGVIVESLIKKFDLSIDESEQLSF